MPRSEWSSGAGNFYLHRVGLEYLVPLYQKKLTNLYTEIAPRTRTTDQRFIRVYTEGDFGMAPQVNQLTGIPFDDFQTPYKLDVTPVKRGIAFAVSTEAVETDQYGVNSNIVPKIARAFNKTKEQAAANLFILADASDTLGPDGQNWASDTHPLEDGTVVDNLSSDALSITALESMMQRIRKHKSHRGDPYPVMGPFMLMVPPDLDMLAQRLVAPWANGTVEQPQTANREQNAARRRISNVHVNEYFTSTTAWGLKPMEADSQGAVMLQRRPFRDKKDDDIIKDATVIACTEMYVFYQDNWRGFEKSVGTG